MTSLTFPEMPGVACLVYLSEVCTFLGDARRAAVLYQCLLPHDGYTLVVGPTAACYGAAATIWACLLPRCAAGKRRNAISQPPWP